MPKLNFEKTINSIIAGNPRCPKCGRFGFEWNGVTWRCIWKDCSGLFTTKQIPEPSYLLGLVNLSQQLKDLKKYKIK